MPRLLLFETHLLGDAILSLPAVRGAMEKYEVTVCCPTPSVPIYRWLLPPERVIAWDAPWISSRPFFEKWSTAFRMTKWVRAQKFDVVASVWPDARVLIWMALLGIPRRIGFSMNRLNYYGWQRPWRKRLLRLGQLMEWIGTIALCRPLLTQSIMKFDQSQRHWTDWQQIATALGTPWRGEIPWMPTNTDCVSAELTQFVREQRSQGRPVWMMHTGAGVPLRRWALERFQALLDDYFPARNCAVIVVQASDFPMHPLSDERQFIFTSHNLDELAAVAALVDGLVSNDTMNAHLAAALGKKTVTLFGPGGIGWFTPYQNEEYIAYVNVCPHRPCIDRCLMPSVICLEQLSLDVVTQKLDLALAAKTTAV